MFDWDIGGIEELEARAERADAALSGGIAGAVTAGIEAGETDAKSNHPYQDRSGDLTRSISGRLESASASGATGVLGAIAPYALYVEGGTKPHSIDPKAGKFLAWGDAGDTHFARHVDHPGTSPMPFMQPAADVASAKIAEVLSTTVVDAVRAELGGG